MKILTILLLIFSISLSAQVTTTVALQRQSLDFKNGIDPKMIKGEFRIQSLLYLKDSNSPYYEYDMNFSFGQEMPKVTIDPKVIKFKISRSKTTASYQISIVNVDKFRFAGDSILVFSMAKPAITEIRCKTNEGKSFTYPVAFELKGTEKKPQFFLSSLGVLAFEYVSPKGDTLKKRIIYNSFHLPNFSHVHNGDSLNFTTDENFVFKDRMYRLTNFDLSNNTVDVISSPIPAKMFGWKVGYHIDDKALSSLRKYAKQPKENKYFIAYFWGAWCSACRDHHQECLDFDASIDRKDVTFIGVHSYFKLKEKVKPNPMEAKTLNLYKNSMSECINDYHKENGSIVMGKAFTVTNFPEFVIIDKEGKIMARDIRRIEDVKVEMKKLGVEL